MANNDRLPFEITVGSRDTSLGFHLQRASRAVARRFDAALRPFGLTSGQFSVLMSLKRREAPSMGSVAAWLAMDRTTLTTNLKPLERRELVAVRSDDLDKRTRRLTLTAKGNALLIAAAPVWGQTHREIERLLDESSAERLCADLRALS
jgi:DNA-binding MarR family transcriptional regulator